MTIAQRTDQLAHHANRESLEPKRSQRYSVWLPLCLAMLVVVSIGLYSQIAQTPQHVPIVSSVSPMAESALYDPEQSELSRVSPTELLVENNKAQQLLLHPGDRVLTTEPKGITPYPGTQRERGVRRSTAGWYEDITLHQTPESDLAVIAEHYRAACAQEGFALHLEEQKADRIRQVFTQVQSSDGGIVSILTIRAQATEAHTRILLWLRTPRD